MAGEKIFFIYYFLPWLLLLSMTFIFWLLIKFVLAAQYKQNLTPAKQDKYPGNLNPGYGVPVAEAIVITAFLLPVREFEVPPGGFHACIRSEERRVGKSV